ncbi:MAG: hypothetical protein IJD35_06960 [Clostridia bacterium]|nr:hypothetical protein [Clostridia bacterium]
MKKRLLFLVLGVVLFLFLPFSVTIYAKEETLPTPESYVEIVADALPDDVKSKLPDGNDYEEMAQNADTSFLLSLSVSFLKQSLYSVYSYLAFFLAALLLGSLAERVEDAFGNRENSLASFIALLLIAFEAFTIVYSLFEEVAEYCKRVSAYMLTFTGVMGSVHLLGGGVMQSTKSGMSLSVTVSLLGSLCSILLLPIIRISFASALTSIASKKINLSSLSAFVRGLFTFLIGLIATVSIVAITFQTMLAQAEDTLAARSIRFAASSSIPIVGNAVGDSVRTLGAAVAVIQKSVGTIGVVGLVIMTLYPLSVLFSAKISLALSKTVAALLDVKSAESLLGEISHLINMLMATVSVQSILYIFVTALFTSSAVPIA